MKKKTELKKQLYLLALMTLLLGLNAQAAGMRKKLSDKKASAEAKALYNTLLRVSEDGKTLSGQMWAPWGIDEIEYVHEVTGKYPVVRGHDLIHEGSNAREVKLMIEWYRHGGIPTLMWHWGAPTKGEGYEQSKMTVDVARCFEEGTPENLAMWADLNRVAGWLEKLKEAKVPVLWRPMHEFDGRWFWYGKGGGELFVRLWQTMYDYFTKERKLHNLIWVLPHSGNLDESYNPGRKYYDIVGPDTYSEAEQDKLYQNVREMHGDDLLVPLHECGTLPDPDKCKKNQTKWIWWMLWHTGHLTGHDKGELKRIYNHQNVLTLDEMPMYVK